MIKKFLPALIAAILSGITYNSAFAVESDDVDTVTMDVIEQSDPAEVTHEIELPDAASDEAREHVNQQGSSDDAHEQHSADTHEDSHDAAQDDAHENAQEQAHEDAQDDAQEQAHEDAQDDAQEQAHEDSQESAHDSTQSGM
jgi:hypothetical protein